VGIAERHATDFATRAHDHDRSGTFPHENWDAMRSSGLLGITVPAEYGGLGVASVHDDVLAFNRLARGDSSTALGAMMHAAGGLLFAGAAQADATTAAAAEPLLRGLEAGPGRGLRRAEPGTSFPWFLVEGTPVDGGFEINGRKIFGTNAPAATHFHVFFRAPDGNGGWSTMSTLVDRDAPGLTIAEDWDALGMRALGSHTLSFANCVVPREAAQVLAPWGSSTPASWRSSKRRSPGRRVL
jgi:alkylation response protein AidB-like acyl-CoA dehydrogenase